jgi:hypothetical protein
MSKENKLNAKLDPEEVVFLNENSLAFIDEMFYRLPFPDIGLLEKLQLELGITADVGTFFAEIKGDYAHARFFDDLRDGH